MDGECKHEWARDDKGTNFTCGRCGADKLRWAEAEIASLTADRDKATRAFGVVRQALKFYADPDSWREPMQVEMANAEDAPTSNAHEDAGRLAREILERCL